MLMLMLNRVYVEGGGCRAKEDGGGPVLRGLFSCSDLHAANAPQDTRVRNAGHIMTLLGSFLLLSIVNWAIKCNAR